MWHDGERVFRRGLRLDDNGKRRAALIVLPAADHPSRSSLDRLTHKYELKDELDGAWAVRPLWSLEPEPLEATPQVNHRMGVPASEAGRGNTALVQSFGDRGARRDALALQRRDRAGHAARKVVCPRPLGRTTSQAIFPR